jgi:membrane-associated phospholipid phosphatase/protein-S-isoprenylcysteine O-methyltransferase Ste14
MPEKAVAGETVPESQKPSKPFGLEEGVDSIARKGSSSIGKVLYGLLFLVVLPVLLIAWSRLTEESVQLPSLSSPLIGIGIMMGGATLMISGMFALVVYGKGLPMNAYPPPRYVTRGAFKLTSHPIYTGFSVLCIGYAIASNSSSGLWLVSPAVILACVALVQGLEKHDLYRRFGHAVEKPLLRLPDSGAEPPNFLERLSVYILVLFPWLVLYEAVKLIGVPRDAVIAFLPFERKLPVYEWTELIYGSTYLFVLVAPLIAKSKRDLREFSISGLIATGLLTLLFVTVPLIAPPRPFEPHSLLGKLLAWERAVDTPAAAFPSFHVVWAFIAAKVYAARMRSWKIVWFGWAVLISISCITTGMHAIVDVVAGFVSFLFVARIPSVWKGVRSATECVANSWKEWRFGPIRVINHGLYAGAGAAAVLCIVGTLLGPDYLTSMMIIAFLIVVTSAIWAQVVEGSPSLLRPYGWYGGILGAVIGIFITGLLGANAWLLAGAFSVAAPWGQALGRLRCLVQGCCHGREAPSAVGIRYIHPRSRVCRLASLAGVPVHPTPLYSILYNIVVAIVMARLWQLHTALSLIVGVYLIVSGLGRFVEESYRGEPQTAIKAGLKLYQWMAILSVLAGVFITMIGDMPNTPELQLNGTSIVAAGCFGVFTWFALGVDFPESNRRFARLA